jgi:hypothetical protein
LKHGTGHVQHNKKELQKDSALPLQPLPLHTTDDNVQVLNINVYLSHQDGKPKHRRKLLAPEKLTFLSRGSADYNKHVHD